jgi:hypothetical protein
MLYSQGKGPWYLLDKRLAGPQSRSGHGGEEKNFQPMPGFEPLIVQTVAQGYTAELSRLLHDDDDNINMSNTLRYTPNMATPLLLL